MTKEKLVLSQDGREVAVSPLELMKDDKNPSEIHVLLNNKKIIVMQNTCGLRRKGQITLRVYVPKNNVIYLANHLEGTVCCKNFENSGDLLRGLNVIGARERGSKIGRKFRMNGNPQELADMLPGIFNNEISFDENRSPGISANRKRILMIDSDEEYLGLSRAELTERGYEFTGLSSLESIGKYASCKFDVLIVDYLEGKWPKAYDSINARKKIILARRKGDFKKIRNLGKYNVYLKSLKTGQNRPVRGIIEHGR
jgi:hypothetical protein